MAKTIEEVIEVNTKLDKIEKLEVIEIFCVSNVAKEEVVYSGAVDNIPDYLKPLKFSIVICDSSSLIIKYINQKSFEGKQLNQQLLIPTQCNKQSL